MGVVYEAVQRSLNRRVALKVLPFAAALDARQLQRFKTEAQAAACLHHPHIVPVFGVGCERGVHYYAMQLIDGQTLAALVAGLRLANGRPEPSESTSTVPHRPVTPAPAADTSPRAPGSTEQAPLDRSHFRRVAELGMQAAEALEHAHAFGIVHRDIKPGNLLVDGRGSLCVTDFGLAQIQSDARLTTTGDLVGTLRYMSPEQGLGKRVVVDHRTDIYSMGATLYELLTLEPVFSGSGRQEVLRQIAFDEPRPLRQLNRSLPVELETIVLKALEKNPTDRYATAKELADDLRRFLADEPIRARPAGLLRQARKWVKRRPALSTAVVLLLTFGAAVLVYRPPPTTAEIEQRAEQEYRKATAHLERELALGRSVSLIDPTAAAPAHRWRAGQGDVNVAGNSGEGGIVTVTALVPSLLELLYDTGGPAYRIVVEMRQENILRDSGKPEVAVAFAFSKYVTELGTQFFFGRVRFADLGRRAAIWKDEAGRPASLFQLGLYHLGAYRSGLDRTRAYGGPSVFYQPPATASPPGPWRRLEIEVRPDKFRALHWDGAAVEMSPEIEAPRALAIFQRLFSDLRGIQPALATRNSVGLFLEGSTLSLRRFDVETIRRGE
jgi:hypothetical protein